jgi:FkbM family methyltransferase
MSFASFVWNKLRSVNRLPGAYSVFYIIANLLYRNGRIVTLRRGPASGLRWRHYHCYQPWMAFGLYEPEVASFIHHSLCSGDVFYDIGANARYFTLLAAKVVGPTGKVIAFDPVPKNVATVQEQIDLNKLYGICSVEPLAIADTDGTASVLIPRRNANAHLAEVDAPHVRSQGGDLTEARSTTLDSYVVNNPWPTFVKMDIEGAEVHALRGAKRLLYSPHAPMFLITPHSEMLAEQVSSILCEAGYTLGNVSNMVHAVPKREGFGQPEQTSMEEFPDSTW